jgi:hypothetical protein
MALYIQQRLKTWAIKYTNKLADSISRWETCRQSRKKIVTATKIVRRMQSRNGNRKLAFLAFATVIMQANGGLHNNQTAFNMDLAPIGINN